MLAQAKGPEFMSTELLRKYGPDGQKSDPGMFSRVPSTSKIKAYKVACAKMGTFDIKNIAQLMEFSADKLCTSKEDYARITEGMTSEEAEHASNKLIVLGTFERSFMMEDDAGNQVMEKTMGLIFSSKCVLERLRVFVESGLPICIQVALFGMDDELKVHCGGLDRCVYIADAYVETWAEIILLLCWPHLARKFKEGEFLKALVNKY
mmetsp:Transcript_36715/g.86246  ORF Transcript_36715/g.86246 Transcript_36715/m.86246 type:complete len:207 (-) Transcript_36715:2051-2671(-)